MLIHLKGCYTLIGKIASSPETEKLSFNVPLKDRSPVVVIMDPNKNSVESFDEVEVSEELWNVIQTETYDESELSEELQTELTSLTSGLSKATRKVLNLIKYCLNQPELDENLFSVKDIYWSLDKTCWNRLRMKFLAIWNGWYYLYLNENTAQAIQAYLEEGSAPLFALRHLHRAKRENNPRYKWIEATIAAELAIKEFLIRKEPTIETLLLEVPSPPIHKLYGTILESFTGERSPKVSKLANGQEVRNKIIHRPEEVEIDPIECNEYIQDVETAIYHLLVLLYPGDDIVKEFYKGPSIRMVRRSKSSP